MTTPSGPIEAIEVRRRESRETERLASCWVRVGRPARPQVDSDALIRADLVATRFPRVERDEPVLVLLGAKRPRSLAKFVADAANKGARVYILAEERTLDKAAAARLAGRKAARVLVRRVAEVPASGVISRRGEAGGVFLASGPAVRPAWWLPLTGEQGAALFRYALHLFWHRAVDEAWADAGDVTFRPPRERPFDVPLPLPRSPVRPSEGDIEPMPWWYSPDGTLPKGGRVDRLVVPPSGDHQRELARRCGEGAAVLWSDIDLPSLGLTDGGGAVLLGGGTERLRVDLAPTQADAIRGLLQRCSEAPEWHFRVDISLKDLDGEVLLPGQETPSPVLEEHPLACGTVVAPSLRRMADAEPSSRPDVPPLARSVLWSWTVEPPRAPSGATVSPLARAWRRLDESAHARVERIRKQLADLEDRTGALSRAFSKLKSAVLGFRRSRSDLLRRAEELAERVPSRLGPDGATDFLSELAALEVEVANLVGEVHRAGEEAEAEQARVEQLEAHEAAKEKARRELAKLTRQQEETREAHERAERELGELAGGGKGLPEKDRRARQKKLRDDATRAERALARIEQKIAEARATREAAFTYRPPKTSVPRRSGGGGARFVPDERTTPISAVPDEALPAVGEFLAHEGSRYLVIARWEDLGQGEKEAERLGARLVAPAEGT